MRRGAGACDIENQCFDAARRETFNDMNDWPVGRAGGRHEGGLGSDAHRNSAFRPAFTGTSKVRGVTPRRRHVRLKASSEDVIAALRSGNVAYQSDWLLYFCDERRLRNCLSSA